MSGAFDFWDGGVEENNVYFCFCGGGGDDDGGAGVVLRYGDGHTEKRGATVAGDRARARDGRSVRPAGPFERRRRRIRS